MSSDKSDLQKLKPVIYGCQGLSLTETEKEFFKKAKPFGFILFKRNCQSRQQIINLIEEFKNISEQDNPAILIDQEGGRVCRLKAPTWQEHYSPGKLIDLLENKNDFSLIEQAIKLNNQLIAYDLNELGINVNCTPVADLLIDGADNIIGDRSFGQDPDIVARLAQLVCDAMLDNNIMPIIKHIPGHGRAKVDSHLSLPIIDNKLDELYNSDFAVFRQLKSAPWAMTAHIIFSTLDPNNPVTTSKIAIKYIREEIGYEGLILTDDLSMQALTGDFGTRATASLEAGCNLLLHCNGNMAEMVQINDVIEFISNETIEKIINAKKQLKDANKLDYNVTQQKLSQLIASHKVNCA
ncbi:MAG: beta-N-acetylhexosaminidase [Pseudomonadota bacterium]